MRPLVLILLAACNDAQMSPGDPAPPDERPDATSAPATTGGSSPADTGDSSTDPGGSGTEPTGPLTDYITVDPSTLPPGLAWVRTNRPFVSGLAVGLGNPPASEIDRYYDDFHATATHLWETGLPHEVEAWAAAGHPGFRWLSWTNQDGANPVTGEAVGDFPVTPGRIGYQVWDEPRDFDEVDAMLPGVERIRAHDPDALVVVNFGNADAPLSNRALFEYGIATLTPDVIAYDLYSSGHGEYERAALIRDLGLANDLAYWRYIDAYGDHGRDEPTDQDLRWAALLGLVYGFSGHSWFLYETDALTAQTVYTSLFDQTGSWTHQPNARFWAAADLNQELETYARTINLLTSTEVRYVPETVLYMPDDHQPWTEGAGGDPWLSDVSSANVGRFETQEWSIGFFEDDDGERYVMVQNAAREGTDFPLYRPRGDLRLAFDFASAPGSLDPTRLQALDPATGGIVDLPLTWLGSSEAELVIAIDAGDVLLFKYATGAPFAQMPPLP